MNIIIRIMLSFVIGILGGYWITVLFCKSSTDEACGYSFIFPVAPLIFIVSFGILLVLKWPIYKGKSTSVVLTIILALAFIASLYWIIRNIFGFVII